MTNKSCIIYFEKSWEQYTFSKLQEIQISINEFKFPEVLKNRKSRGKHDPSKGVLLNGARSEVNDPLSPLPFTMRSSSRYTCRPSNSHPFLAHLLGPISEKASSPFSSYTWHRRRPGLAYSEKSSFSANSALTGRLKGPLERGSAQLKANLAECDGSGRAWSIGRLRRETSWDSSRRARLSGRPRGSASRWLADDKVIATANQDPYPREKNGRDKRKLLVFLSFFGGKGELQNILERGLPILRESLAFIKNVLQF